MRKVSLLFITIGVLILIGVLFVEYNNTEQGLKASKQQVKIITTHHQQMKRTGKKIGITINDNKLTAHLNNSSAAKEFARELPSTLSFRDYPGLPEKIADLGHKLPTNGMPSGHAGTRGSIGYWSPQQRIVFYWGTEDYYEGIHIIGHFDTNDYRRVVKNMGNDINVKIAEGK